MANECLCTQVESKHGRHVERGASLDILNVGIGPRLNEQLHAEGPVWKVGSVVERGLSTVVECIEGDTKLEQDIDNDILAVVAGNMERSAAVGIDGIRLQENDKF